MLRSVGKEGFVMRRMILALVVAMASALLVLAAGVGSAHAQGSTIVVGPGESIQKAVYAADPYDTIVVKGVHREDVVVRKDGIKLRGENAVIEAPPRAKADSPCSKAFGPEAICVLGSVNVETDKVTGPRVKDVSIRGFTFRGFNVTGGDFGSPQVIDVYVARDVTVAGNRLLGNAAGGIGATRSIGETIAKNRIVGSPQSHGDGIIVQVSSHTKVLQNVVRNIRDYDSSAIGVISNSVDTTVAGNDLEDNLGAGAFVEDSTGTKILSNEMRRSGIVGIYMFGPNGPKQANNSKVVGNNISGGPWGIYVEGAHGGSFVGNDVRDNCAGMFFEAFKGEPVGGFALNGNTLADNTRSCRSQDFGRNFSGIGIALLGAHDMEVSTNHIWGNVPSGPTPISGGVVVSKDPYFQDTDFGGKQKPTNNTVSANRFGRNKPDIYWDKSGSGNTFSANLCDTSVPGSLCK